MPGYKPALIARRFPSFLEESLVTQARVPSGVIATATGSRPTVMVATTVLVAVSMAETVSPRHSRR
jgi:hypothetical protein